MIADLTPLVVTLPWLIGAWLLLTAADRVLWWARPCGGCGGDAAADVANELQELRGAVGDVFGVLEELNGTAREIRDQPRPEATRW